MFEMLWPSIPIQYYYQLVSLNYEIKYILITI